MGRLTITTRTEDAKVQGNSASPETNNSIVNMWQYIIYIQNIFEVQTENAPKSLKGPL